MNGAFTTVPFHLYRHIESSWYVRALARATRPAACDGRSARSWQRRTRPGRSEANHGHLVAAIGILVASRAQQHLAQGLGAFRCRRLASRARQRSSAGGAAGGGRRKRTASERAPDCHGARPVRHQGQLAGEADSLRRASGPSAHILWPASQPSLHLCWPCCCRPSGGCWRSTWTLPPQCCLFLIATSGHARLTAWTCAASGWRQRSAPWRHGTRACAASRYFRTPWEG
jgi:hypothetical protein